MSRVGKIPLSVPSGVSLKKRDGELTFNKGSKSQSVTYPQNVLEVVVQDNVIMVKPKNLKKSTKQIWGTTRMLFFNAMKGLNIDFEKKLKLVGVGYRAQLQGSNILKLQLGYSHDIDYIIPEDVSISVGDNIITIKGISKQRVGMVASEIRSYRKPEPYHGKGVRYLDEKIFMKEGKKK